VVGSWGATANNLPLPTQVCVESNWTGFVTWGFLPLVRNRLGEVWEPFHAAPNPEASAASSFQLVATNAAPGRFASAWCGEPRIYEVRSDGTLWERTQPLNTQAATPVGEWHRLGKRSDWTALWGTGAAALGMTADGTLWTWGIDPGGQPALRFPVPAQAGSKPAAELDWPGAQAHGRRRPSRLSGTAATLDAVGVKQIGSARQIE
jgi:hypothetical protein